MLITPLQFIYIFAGEMRDMLNILWLLLIASVVLALSSSSEQQGDNLSIVEQIEAQISESSQSSLLNIIPSRQSSTTPSARRLCSSHRHHKAHFTTVAPAVPTVQFKNIFVHKPTIKPSLSLVFRLHNIRI